MNNPPTVPGHDALAHAAGKVPYRSPSAMRVLVVGGELRLEYSDVQVDLAPLRATRRGHRLELTSKEYALLVFFMRHAGQPVSRARIYEQVWCESFDGRSNTLQVHLVGLRRKLEAHGPRLIHTVRGHGYRFGDLSPQPAASAG